MTLYARDVMERDPLFVDEDTSCRRLAELMSESRHGFALIRDAKGEAVGIVTEWDLVNKVLARGLDPSSTSAGDVMTRGVVSVDAGEELSDVAELMAKRGIRRVMVTERGKIVGFITCRIVLANLKSYVDSVSRDLARYGLLPF
ncbi:MAG: cyclic nucleotide-binding/CBS domain-containing protein [Conexivisphaera sp.]